MDAIEHELQLLGSHTKYWEYGTPESGPTIVVVHGYRGDHHGLEPVVNLLDDFHVISPDLPGFGDSTPMTERPHTIDGYGAWLAFPIERPFSALAMAAFVVAVLTGLGALGRRAPSRSPAPALEAQPSVTTGAVSAARPGPVAPGAVTPGETAAATPAVITPVASAAAQAPAPLVAVRPALRSSPVHGAPSARPAVSASAAAPSSQPGNVSEKPRRHTRD